jgi:hypothetical protein
MKRNEDNVHYSINYKVGLILSLLIVIGFFLFLPKIEDTISQQIKYSEPLITIVDIPQTNNSGPPIKPPPKQLPLNNANFIPVEENIELEEIVVEDITLDQNGSDKNSPGSNSGETSVYESSSLPFIPRQILEVVPKEVEGAKGQILLSLWITKDGSVKEHKIVRDDTNKSECLKNVLTSVYKSRWQPITIDGKRVEYWVEKLYGFN